MADIKRDNLGRFIKGSHVKEQKYSVNPETGCWEWLLKKDYGYGRMRVGYKSKSAHRVMYENKYGEIPRGMHLDHLCRNRACVNPDHLEPVTVAINVQRSNAAKLKPENINEIRTKYKNRECDQYELAHFFGVTQAHISDIVCYRRWKNI